MNALRRVVSGERRLRCFTATPTSPPRTVLSVVFPPAEERKGCVRVARELADDACAAGMALAACDASGTGDSPGAFDEVTWDSLVADCAATTRFLRGEYPDATVCSLGVRLGARIAFDAAAAEPPDRFVLWEPVFDGAAWFRETTRRSRFRGTGGELDDGGFDADGYRIGPSLRARLESMDADPPTPTVPCALVQIGPREEPGPSTRRLAERLGCGDAVRAVRMQPFWLEHDVSDTTALREATLAAPTEDRP